MKKNVFVFIALLYLLVFAQQRFSAPPQETLPVTGTFTDSRDGQSYRTVKIGKLTWMAENLNFDIDSSWCYNDDNANCAKYGRLYAWVAAVKACAGLGDGWRLPDTANWYALLEAVGGWEIAGIKLKSKAGWQNDNNGTDEFGFMALPGGGRSHSGSFRYVSEQGFWWGATKNSLPGALNLSIVYYDDCVFVGFGNRSVGLSVRCVQDVHQ
ncbi:MAG: fibrobacter succinogenes major paralogous domain-containing protein [Prevotellaceae bacterium]|jgi:uncharacterized protein (TIGR02145 family)|nr:fibrobacter succinogenes major paralogous domain-containing protein [Prevotellaceae bacterium]